MKSIPGRTGIAALALLQLAGCTDLFKSSAGPEQTYYLRAPAVPAGNAATAAAPAGRSLRVARPSADPGLDSSHITLRQSDHRMSFYAGSRWPAAMPDMVAALAVQTLRASGQWDSVADAGSPFPADYLLQCTIGRYDADYAAVNTAPEVHVVLDCTVGRRDGRDVVGTFVVAGSARAGANSMSEVVGAFEQASGTALQGLADQALAAVRADAAHATQNGANPAPSSSLHSQ